MKKLFLLIPLLLVACAKTPVYIAEQPTEVTFTQSLTKAIVDTTILPDNFGVYGYVTPVAGTTNGGYIMKNAEYTPAGIPAVGAYYWPKADDNSDITVKFSAYFPYTSSTVLDGDDFSYAITANQVGFDNCTDVLYAVTITNPQIAAVPLQFKHALSWIEFTGRIDTVSVVSAVITGITFSSPLATTGTLKVNTKNASTTPTISNLGNTQAFEFSSGADTLTYNYADFKSDAIIIPQTVPTTVTITFNLTLKGADGTIYYNGRTITRTINTGNDANDNPYVASFQGGHKYIYRVYVTADDIDFSVTVDNWDDDVFQVWDHDATAYVEHFFEKASMLMATNSETLYMA